MTFLGPHTQMIAVWWIATLGAAIVLLAFLRARRRRSLTQVKIAEPAPLSPEATARLQSFVTPAGERETSVPASSAPGADASFSTLPWPQNSLPVAPDATSGTEAAKVHGLYSMALLCSRNDIEISGVLAQIADLIPAATGSPLATVCRLDVMGSSYWSSGYVEPQLSLEQTIVVSGAQVGSIRLGDRPGANTTSSRDANEDLLRSSAQFVGQMLGRRLDRRRTEEQGRELERRQMVLEQTQRLAKLGAWEYDVATKRFSWSHEARRIAATQVDETTPPARDDIVAGFLRVAIDEALKTRSPINRELPCAQPDGKRRWLHAIGEVEYAEAEPVKVAGIVRDITEEKETQNRLLHMANHDALTGLANRRHFLQRLDIALLARGATGALILIDLDNFKDINDAEGHDVGDALLKSFARRLEESAGGAFVARLGGDEFIALLTDADRHHAERWARGLVSKLREPVTVFGRQTSVRLSAGFTSFPEDGRDATELMKNVDLAVYAAKARGRNTMVNYSRHIREESERRVAICSEVQVALADNQFVPFYQPKISLKTGQPVGFEALLRWNHPEGIRTPGSILPAFDVPELSRAICNRMLDRIIKDMTSWQGQGIPFGRIAFNASSAEFSGFDLASCVLWRMNAIGLSPSLLGLEVTETVFLGRDSDSIASVLRQLHQAGVEIALDDFGTGYGSLTHLQKFPVDVIKIDQSFVRNLITDAGSQAITSVVLGLGRSLGMKVVAEGVETAEQAKMLQAAGCDEVQGYYFARPMPASDVPGFFSRWRGDEELARVAA